MVYNFDFKLVISSFLAKTPGELTRRLDVESCARSFCCVTEKRLTCCCQLRIRGQDNRVVTTVVGHCGRNRFKANLSIKVKISFIEFRQRSLINSGSFTWFHKPARKKISCKPHIGNATDSCPLYTDPELLR